MRQSKKRGMTISLIVIGIVMLAIAGTLLATFPWHDPASFTQGFPAWMHGPGNGYGYGYGGYHHGWFMHGPRFFGGGLIVLVLVILVISSIVRRGRYWGHDGPDRSMDAEEILRRTFAEGRITEEEYKSRLGALRK
jgi:uncharacterized membrane protein